MCRFKWLLKKKRITVYSFNTSYVSVQAITLVKDMIGGASFNTSYVSVQEGYVVEYMKAVASFNTSYVSVQDLTERLPNDTYPKFQYILCVGSSCLIYINSLTCFYVSIHPMCRFKSNSSICAKSLALVSIHPMCRFKSCENGRHFLCHRVSIHPMCRFKLF